MKTIKLTILTAVVMTLLAVTSCGTKKNVGTHNDGTTSATTITVTSQQQTNETSITFLKQVTSKQVTAKNIVADMTFRMQINGDNVKVPGSLHMRHGEMIRIQLFIPLLGSEVGRVEFTPKGVLLIDRMHKEYVQATYNDLDFLKNNGIDFYTLQALFWNQLALPGTKRVDNSQLDKFEVSEDGQATLVPVKYEKDRLQLQWNVERQSLLIKSVNANYTSDSHGSSMLTCNYDKFVNVDGCQYPSKQDFSIITTAKEKQKTMRVTIEMDDVKTNAKWDLQTKLSDKYTKVDAKDVLGKLLKF